MKTLVTEVTMDFLTALALYERLTFDKLFKASDPKRVARSFTVRGPPLEIDSYQDAVYYAFNFKANPSTTGLRHKGYVKFFKGKNGQDKPLQHTDCLVDCTCPDFRYRWAWANKQRGSSRVGANSLNQALNRAPRKTNPTSKVGMCKHLLAMREYIYGLLASFPAQDRLDTADKLNSLTKYATKRWANFDELVRQAKEREREMTRRRELRNRYGPIAPQGPPTAPPVGRRERPGEMPQPPQVPPVPQPAAPAQPARPARPAQPPQLAIPPGQRGRTLPQVPEPPTEYGPYGGYKTKAEQEFRRRQGLGDSVVHRLTNLLMERVVKSNGNMNTLLEAKKIVEDMEDEALQADAAAGPGAGPEMGGDMGGGMEGGDMGMGADVDMLPPGEPPISDTAIGADTEGDTALGLLTQMKDLLTVLVTAVAPESEVAPEAEAGGAPGAIASGDAGAEFDMGDMPPEPPVDAETPTEGKPEEDGAGEDGPPEEDEEDEPSDRRPDGD